MALNRGSPTQELPCSLRHHRQGKESLPSVTVCIRFHAEEKEPMVQSKKLENERRKKNEEKTGNDQSLEETLLWVEWHRILRSGEAIHFGNKGIVY